MLLLVDIFFIIIDYRILLVGLLECNFLMTPFVHQLVGRSVLS